MSWFLYISASQTSAGMAHLENLSKHRSLAPYPRFLMQQVWGGIWEFLISSQVVLMLLVWGPTFRTTVLDQSRPHRRDRVGKRWPPNIILGTLLPEEGRMDIFISSIARVLAVLLCNHSSHQYVGRTSLSGTFLGSVDAAVIKTKFLLSWPGGVVRTIRISKYTYYIWYDFMCCKERQQGRR